MVMTYYVHFRSCNIFLYASTTSTHGGDKVENVFDHLFICNIKILQYIGLNGATHPMLTELCSAWYSIEDSLKDLTHIPSCCCLSGLCRKNTSFQYMSRYILILTELMQKCKQLGSWGCQQNTNVNYLHQRFPSVNNFDCSSPSPKVMLAIIHTIFEHHPDCTGQGWQGCFWHKTAWVRFCSRKLNQHVPRQNFFSLYLYICVGYPLLQIIICWYNIAYFVFFFASWKALDGWICWYNLQNDERSILIVSGPGENMHVLQKLSGGRGDQ